MTTDNGFNICDINKEYDIILTKKQQKYQPYHHVKLINMNILR